MSETPMKYPISEDHRTESGSVLHSIPAPVRQLHVVLHGLICVRMSLKTGTVELHFPRVNASSMHGMNMPGHIYRAGTFSDLRRLPTDDNFYLSGVQVGDFVPILDRTQDGYFKDNFVSFCMGDEGVGCDYQAHGTHAVVRLPWPKCVSRLRLNTTAPAPLFWYGAQKQYQVNPVSFGYISYLTYDLEWDRPVLFRGCETFWSSEALNDSTRLHFFADPPSGLSGDMYAGHVKAAYQAFDQQLFSPAFDLTPNVREPHPDYNPPNSEYPIPSYEQTDLAPALTDGMPLLGGPLVGNCLAVFVLD